PPAPAAPHRSDDARRPPPRSLDRGERPYCCAGGRTGVDLLLGKLLCHRMSSVNTTTASEPLNENIEACGLFTWKIRDMLVSNAIRTIPELLERSGLALLRLSGFGVHSLRHVQTDLAKRSLLLRRPLELIASTQAKLH